MLDFLIFATLAHRSVASESADGCLSVLSLFGTYKYYAIFERYGFMAFWEPLRTFSNVVPSKICSCYSYIGVLCDAYICLDSNVPFEQLWNRVLLSGTAENAFYPKNSLVVTYLVDLEVSIIVVRSRWRCFGKACKGRRKTTIRSLLLHWTFGFPVCAT